MLKPYDEYKKTNIPWLEEVPSHWETKKINELFKERKSKVSDKDFAPLSVTKKGIVPQLSSAAKSNDSDNRKLVCEGDFVINSRSDRKGSSGISPLTGSVSLINIALEPRKQNNSQFMHHLLKSNSFIEEYYRNGRGIVADLWTTRYSEMKTITLPVPTREEQDQIVKYLDWQTSKINTLIKAKKKQIELLKEQKQAVINKAVTKGLDDTVPMKDSGIEWLGEVPEHWGITKAGKVYDIELGKMLQPNRQKDTDTFEPYVCALNVYWDRIDVHNLKQMWFSSIEREKYKLLKGDLIVVEGGDVATSYIWNHDISCYMQNAVHRVRPKKYSLNKYLYYWLFALKHMGYFEQICSKATFAHFTKEKFVSLLQLLPPLDEQQAIVTYLEEKTVLIDKAIAVIEKEIELVSEYKTSLISSVVTGKVDVRDVVVPDFEVVEEVAADIENDDEGVEEKYE